MMADRLSMDRGLQATSVRTAHVWCRMKQSTKAKKVRTMERIRTLPRMFSLVMFLGIASLVLPLPAHAGGLRVSIGLGLPVPVVVAPAPMVVTRPHPMIVQSALVVVTRPPVIAGEPCVGYERPYYGGYHRPWRHWKHHRHDND
jgi:hypothetical protein